jgi:hypothetical protein
MRTIRWIACVSMLSALLMLHHSSTAAQTADLHDLDAFIARALKEYQGFCRKVAFSRVLVSVSH